MYTAPESFYRAEDGTISTTPSEGCEMVAACGAVMSKQEARDRGLLPSEAPSETAPKSKATAKTEAKPSTPSA